MRCKYCNTELVEIQVGNYKAWSCPSKACKDQRWPTGQELCAPSARERNADGMYREGGSPWRSEPHSRARDMAAMIIMTSPRKIPSSPPPALSRRGGESFHHYWQPICVADPDGPLAEGQDGEVEPVTVASR